jgi:hypothetical protein
MGSPTAQAFSRWPGFDPRPVRVEFVMDEVALEKIFLQVIGLSPCQTQFTDVFLFIFSSFAIEAIRSLQFRASLIKHFSLRLPILYKSFLSQCHIPYLSKTLLRSESKENARLGDPTFVPMIAHIF